MTLPVLIAGVILVAAGRTWFPGAGTVGTILIIAGSAGLAVQAAVFAWGVRQVRQAERDQEASITHARVAATRAWRDEIDRLRKGLR